MRSSTQSSFLDADYLCDQLIPQDSFYRKFRDHVWPIIKDKHFESMYCGEMVGLRSHPGFSRWRRSFNSTGTYQTVKWNELACSISRSSLRLA